MSEKFKYTRNEVICTTPSGAEFVVAETSDMYWADAIAYALNFLREEF